jgi:acryloyl-coenzyme A reductase
MATFADALAMVAAGRVAPVVTPYPLDAVEPAFHDLDAHAVTGRIVLVP